MLKTDLYKRTSYLNKNIEYLFNCEIREYDLKSADMSLMKQFKLVSADTIASLEKMDKDSRHKRTGMMQKDKKLAKALVEAFKEARRMFFDANDVEDWQVLSIKKDAIFILKNECENNTFGALEFRVKNQYLGYMYLNKTEFLYRDRESDIDVKGLGKNVNEKHNDYMLDFIRDVFIYRIYKSYPEQIDFLSTFIKAYRAKDLDIGYYRQLDNEGYYKILNNGEEFMMDDLSEDDIGDVDIKYNYSNYLVPIVNIFI